MSLHGSYLRFQPGTLTLRRLYVNLRERQLHRFNAICVDRQSIPKYTGHTPLHGQFWFRLQDDVKLQNVSYGLGKTCLPGLRTDAMINSCMCFSVLQSAPLSAALACSLAVKVRLHRSCKTLSGARVMNGVTPAILLAKTLWALSSSGCGCGCESLKLMLLTALCRQKGGWKKRHLPWPQLH